MMYQAILYMPPFTGFVDIPDRLPKIEIPLFDELRVVAEEKELPDDTVTGHKLVFDYAYQIDNNKLFYRFRKLD